MESTKKRYQNGINDTTRKNTLFLFALLCRGSVVIKRGLNYPIPKIRPLVKNYFYISRVGQLNCEHSVNHSNIVQL